MHQGNEEIKGTHDQGDTDVDTIITPITIKVEFFVDGQDVDELKKDCRNQRQSTLSRRVKRGYIPRSREV